MKVKLQQLAKALQDVSIQNKLVGIFAVVFVAGVLAIGWNIYNLNTTRRDVRQVITDSRKQIRTTLTSSKDDVANFSAGNVDQVNLIFDRADEVRFLQVVRFEFYEMEAYEKDYVLAGDPSDPSNLVGGRADYSGWIHEDLASLRNSATNDTVSQLATDLLTQLDTEDVQFAAIVEQMQTDPEAARQLSLEGSTRKADTIYNPLATVVNDQWNTMIDGIDQSRTQLLDTLDQTNQRMQTSIDETDQQMTSSLKHADSQMKRAINISLLTIALFALAGAVVAVTTFVVSRQIVQPVLAMSVVAEAIEKEQYQDQTATSLDPIAVRQDEIGKLARVFGRMASEVFSRVERLKQQVAELRIVIDEQKMASQVSEITDSEYFTELQTKVKTLRRRSKPEEPSATSEPPKPETPAV